ncbi:cell division protein FtsK [Actinocatenispora thailandica]|nr:cell division protein FtsK [Actinocatenispora thailandica]
MAATGTDGNGADVVDLAEARRRAAADGIDVDQVDADDEFYDHESVRIDRPELGRPVDPPDEPRTRSAGKRDRAPVVPVWLNSRANIRTSLVYGMKEARYRAGYHAIRSPKYAGKAIVYAPVGFVRTVHRLGSWAMAERHNWDLRQHAADRGDADTWMKLDARRQRQSRWRWTLVLSLGAIAAAGTSFLALGPVPTAGKWAALALAVPVLARLGRPADKPITDRVSAGKTYRKLTAELVRRALTSIQLSGINRAVAQDPGAISFPTEIHRDGPGHMAIVDLPYGVEASDVIARRGRLASALRLPLDQVWPETAPGHTGRLGLWVGFEPASQMKQPAWPLISGGKVDVFKPFPFATTPRLETVNAELMSRNWLFGGQPGSGKTFALRDLVLAAALDVRTEIRGYELKGVGDFGVVAPVCAEYGNGFDDDTIAGCAAMLDWLYEECRRRSKRIDHYAKLGKAPENKVTPELASLKGSGLHPLVVFIDEIQELFRHPKYGKKAGEIAEKVIKLGRALGVVLLIGTQIPDKDSLPTGITRNVNTRFCLSVADQTANDMILGTSAYKNGYRATVFEPVVEAGWGILSGIGKPAALRSYYVDTDQAGRVMARAIEARTKAGVMPAPDEQTRDTSTGYDVLADVATVWPQGDEKAWNETLIERLSEYRADVYAGWKPEQLTAALAVHGVKVGQVGRRVDGKTVNRRGPAQPDILAAIAERNGKRQAE